ncbi:MAG: isoamylase early set domain-containing protein [Candidatus Krumholzibacteriia bacterium]
MALKKKNLKSKPVTKVTFELPATSAREAAQVWLVGDFNEWDRRATPMKRLKNGGFKVTVDLERGREYQFRYLLDGNVWENDEAADRYIASGFEGAENSVVEA